ncbi:MAG: aminotransferase class IV [Gemmatimonadetes bacterium]|nr:aminotransferase class IV [Gemmatimonadota bacterium]
MPKASVHLSPDDRGFLFGDGVYEVVRSYGGRFFALDAHLQRMHNGLCELQIRGVDAAAFAEICKQLLERNDLSQDDALVYMQVTRGVAPRSHAFPNVPTQPTSYAVPSPFQPKGDVTKGVKVITAPDIRWTRCDIKSVNLLANCLANQRAQEAGATEAILVRDGVALEATASSFFGVFNGEVRTAPKSNYILPSITRQAALDICREAGISAIETPIHLTDLASADELFLAGTTLEIMPIIEVDGRVVGNGRPGPVQQRLYELFCRRTRGAGVAAATAGT